MQASLTHQDSLSRRLLAWANERFPLSGAIGCAIIFVSALVVGRATTPGPIAFGPLDVLSLLAAVSFFLLLRVFDEHKDYEEDVPNYPERVLSRGLITLNHLKVVGALCLFAQLGTALAADRGFGRITVAWALTIIYALLMLKEFFIADWLKVRLVPYALSHMVVSPLSMVWFYLIGASDRPLGSELLWLSLLAYASAAGFEVARKTRGPEEERPSVDSYSQRMGVPLAMLLLVFVHGVAFFATFMLLRDLSASTTMVLVTASFFLPLLASIAAFVRAPSAKGRKSNEGLTALSLVFCHLAPVITLISQRGYSW